MAEFIIVIEACNKRASAAYAKGLHDLDLIMPQLMLAAEWSDEKRRIERDERLEKAKEIEEKNKKALDDWRAEMDEWNAKCSLFRGPRPRQPMEQRNIYEYFVYSELPSHASYLKSTRAELKEKLDLACAAIGPFRMTEHQVKEMIAWEDGSKIESLKKDFLSKK